MTDEKLTEIHLAVANVTLVWAELENALCLLLGEFLGGTIRHGPKEMASVIFFAPTSLDARIDIVDSGFHVAVRQIPDSAKLIPIWNRMIRRINRNKKTRDLVAHGQIAKFETGELLEYRIVPPVTDPRFTKQVRNTNKPGRSAHELRQAQRSVKEIEVSALSFYNLLRSFWGGREEDYAQALHVLQAVDRKNTQAGDQRSRSREKD